MKNLILLCMLFLISCTRDVIEPKNYIIKVVFDNVAVTSQEIIATKVYPLEIESITLNRDLKFKAECRIDESVYVLYDKIRFDTRKFNLGTHILYIKIFYEDEEIGEIQQVFTLIDDIPEDRDLGTYTKIFKICMKTK